jgi:peptidoglycan/LPS O-acetylase OafA/YrhL
LATISVQSSTLGEPQAERVSAVKFQTIQALRAIAALLVVIDHALDMWVGRIKPGGASVWANGAAGVDIFFVVSGFVMVISSQRLQYEPGAWWIFMRHRIVRIVPLYWLMTTVKWLLVFVFADLALRSSLDPDFVVRSYLFLPLVDNLGQFRPLLPVGWTLTYEFLFYFLFAFALAMRVNVLGIVVPVFAAFCVFALMRTDEWPVSTVLFDTIIVEFIFGVVLAKLILHQWTMPPAVAAVLALIGFALILTVPQVSEDMRPVTWGLPALAIIAGAVSLEKHIAAMLPRWLLSLGDASYSIYLTHSLVLPMLGIGIAALHWTSIGALVVVVVACLALASAVGWLCYIVVERPMTLWLKNWAA